MKYEDLPQWIQDKLFKAHQHMEYGGEYKIVYFEQDVIDIIEKLLNKKA